MPRDLPLGNGSLPVNFDQDSRWRDTYLPNVPCCLDVRAERKIAWTGPDWRHPGVVLTGGEYLEKLRAPTPCASRGDPTVTVSAGARGDWCRHPERDQAAAHLSP